MTGLIPCRYQCLTAPSQAWLCVQKLPPFHAASWPDIVTAPWLLHFLTDGFSFRSSHFCHTELTKAPYARPRHPDGGTCCAGSSATAVSPATNGWRRWSGPIQDGRSRRPPANARDHPRAAVCPYGRIHGLRWRSVGFPSRGELFHTAVLQACSTPCHGERQRL